MDCQLHRQPKRELVHLLLPNTSPKYSPQEKIPLQIKQKNNLFRQFSPKKKHSRLTYLHTLQLWDTSLADSEPHCECRLSMKHKKFLESILKKKKKHKQF
jgi:hypothetical protein